MTNADSPAAQIRRLLTQSSRAYLGTLAERGGEIFPFASLVLPGLDAVSRPLLLLSDLSDHARNLRRDPHASLLYDGTAVLKEPLTGPRATLIGRVEAADNAENRRLYLEAQPSAAQYAGFGDFHLYGFEIQEALLVAGFGKIHRVAGNAL